MMRQTCILTTVATLLLLGTGALAEMSFYVPHKGKTGKTEWTNKKKIAEPIRTGDPQLRLENAIDREDVNDMGAAMANGANIDVKGDGGQTPLMKAVLTGNDIIAQALINLKADTTIEEMDGYVPIHGAGFQGRAAIAKMLIKAGLDPMTNHTDGYIPMHRACWGKKPRHTETVKVFLDAGVPYDTPGPDGQLPVEMARMNQATRIMLEEWELKEEAVAKLDAELEELEELHAAGALTDEELAASKAKLEAKQEL